LARDGNRTEAMNYGTKAKPGAITRTLSLAIHRVRLKKNLLKSTSAFNGG